MSKPQSQKPNTPRVFHAHVQDASFHALFVEKHAATDGNLAQVQNEAERQAAEPGARVIAYEQSEEEKMNVPIIGGVGAGVHRPTEPGEDSDEPGKDNEVRGLVVELVRSVARLAISVAKSGIPRPAPTPPVQHDTRGKDVAPHRVSAADIADARRAGAGKAVDEANARVTDGIDPLKEAGFEVPLRYVWDPISARYRIF
jgi:hypothetical protein